MIDLYWFVIFVEKMGILAQIVSSCKLQSEQISKKYLCFKHKILYMVLIGELVKDLNLYTNARVAHHSNMNNNSKTKAASKRLWMHAKGSIQLSLFDMVFVLHFKILCGHFLDFFFFLEFALHYIHAFILGCFLFVFQ